MRRGTAARALLSAFAVGVFVGSSSSALAAGNDGTETFHKVYQSLGDKRFHAGRGDVAFAPDDHEKYAVVIVRGFLGNTTDRVTKNGYFGSTVNAFRDRGFTVHVAPINTAASIGPDSANAATLRRTILDAAKDGKRVIVVSHSMGGALTAATLAKHKDELVPLVAGHVADSAAYRGTRLADIVRSNPATRAVANVVVRSVGGHPDVVKDLSVAVSLTRTRLRYPREIPTVSITPEPPVGSAMWAPSKVFKAAKLMGRNDGMVSTRSSTLPGSTRVSIAGDHSTGVLSHVPLLNRKMPGERYEPGRLNVAAAAMILQGRTVSRPR